LCWKERLTKIQRGAKARKQRFEGAMKKFSVLIEEIIFEQLQQLVRVGWDYQKLINNALQEWLSAKGIKGLVRKHPN